MPSRFIRVEIDSRQIVQEAERANRTRDLAYRAAQRHARAAALKMRDYVVAYTPRYDGGSYTTNEPGGLAESWDVRNLGAAEYEIVPVGDSHAGFDFAAPYTKVVLWLTEGVAEHTITGNPRLWWDNVADYGFPGGIPVVDHPGIPAHDFLEEAFEAGIGSGVLEDTGNTYLYEIESYMGYS